MTGDKNPRRKEGLTPLHIADGKVQFILLSWKNSGNKKGKHHFIKYLEIWKTGLKKGL